MFHISGTVDHIIEILIIIYRCFSSFFFFEKRQHCKYKNYFVFYWPTSTIFKNNYLFFKFINKYQKEILSCAPPSSHLCDFFCLRITQLFFFISVYQLCQICGKLLYPGVSGICQCQPKLILMNLQLYHLKQSGIPLRIMFSWPYCAKALWLDSYFAQHLWDCSHFCQSFPFSLWRFLITISFRSKISSFRQLIQWLK